MSTYLPGIFAFLVAAAGWFYMFYSKAALNLSGVESQKTNRLRIRLRRVGGSAMIALAVTFYLACVSIDRRDIQQSLLYIMAVLVLLGLIIFLGLIDLRLTNKLRKSNWDEP